MHIEKYIPVPALRPFIRQFMIIESEHELHNYTLPDTALVMAFRLQGSVSANDTGALPYATISGLRRTFRSLHYEDKTANLLVVFSENGAAAFFKPPLYELFGNTLSLDNFIHRQDIADVTEQLMAAKDHHARIHIIQQFLSDHLRQPQPDLLIAEAVKMINQADGNLRISSLPAALHISQDAFEKRFRKVTGATARQFASIVRLRSIIHHADHTTLTALAYQAGYFDQSHFIKDFRSFTGKTPREFYKAGNFW